MLFNNLINNLQSLKNLLVFLIFIFFIDFSYADCISALKKCELECKSVSVFFNFEKGKFESVNGTDFTLNCMSSCRRGFRYCTSEVDLDISCDEFKRKCRNDCPNTIFSFKNGVFQLLTDANNLCEGACQSGYRRCQ